MVIVHVLNLILKDVEYNMLYLQIKVLLGQEAVKAFLRAQADWNVILDSLNAEQKYLLLCLPAMQQEHVLTLPTGGKHWTSSYTVTVNQLL